MNLKMFATHSNSQKGISTGILGFINSCDLDLERCTVDLVSPTSSYVQLVTEPVTTQLTGVVCQNMSKAFGKSEKNTMKFYYIGANR